MTIGTKSILYGAHAFWLHPFFVAKAWTQLYGFPFDPRLWVSFFFHDIGYAGKPNMDGPEGETHPYLGASLVTKLCGTVWGDFTLLHSRSLAKTLGRMPSKLCAADKLAFCLTPKWLYLKMVNLTGEIHEYKSVYLRKYNGLHVSDDGWHDFVNGYLNKWVRDYETQRKLGL